jgi:hypothetical protein
MNETQRPDFIPEEPPAEIDEVVPVMKSSDEIVTSNSMFIATGDEYSKKEARKLGKEKLNILSVLFYTKEGYLVSGLTGEWEVYYLGTFMTTQEFNSYHDKIIQEQIQNVSSEEAVHERMEF